MLQDWRTVKVFISSTFRDMQAERDHLVRFVFPRLREELLKRRIHLVDVDLRWGVTSEQNVLEVCQVIIDECRPRFLCMLGGRYGWTPTGREESITAQEIRYAVLHRPEVMEYRFFYFRDPQVTAAIPEAAAKADGYREFPTPEEISEFGPEEAERRAQRRAEKLKALKQDVIDVGFIPCCYSARWDGSQQRLVDLKAFGDQVYEDLLWSIDDELGMEAPQELDEFATENAAMAAFVQERSAGYVVGNRQGLLQELTAFAEGQGQPNVLAVSGDAGSGKSALLAKFYLDYIGTQEKPAHPQELVIPHFIGASPGSTDLRRTLRRFCHELAQYADLQGEIPQDLQELVRRFPELLRQVPGVRQVVLIIDALNQLDAAGNAQAMYWLPYDLPANVRVIVSSLEHPVLEALKRWGEERVRVKELAPLNEDDSLNIICSFLGHYSKNLEADQIGLLICKEESGNPLYLFTALEELRTLGTYEEITQRIKELPPLIPELFRWIFQRLERDPGFQDREGRLIGKELVRGFASLLGVSRYGLSQIELAELLAPGDPQTDPHIPPDPQGNVAALLRLLRPYLMRRGELLDFYHGQFRHAAKSTYLVQDEDCLPVNCQLSEYFKHKVDPAGDSTWIGDYPRGLTELPYHLLHAGQRQSLADLLCDITYLDTRCIYCNVYDLVSNFDWIEQRTASAAKRWQTVLRRHAQRLSQYRGLLFTLVYHEGFTEAQEQAHRLAQQGKWQRPWLRTHPMWLPSTEQADHEIKAVSLITECRFTTSSFTTVAATGRKAFFLAKLGVIRVIDLVNGRELDLVIGIREQRLRAIFSSDDGQSLAVAYENGEADLLFFTLNGEGLPAESGSDAIRLKYRDPEFEKPVFAFIHGALWYQDESGVLSNRRLSNPGNVQARVDLGSEFGDWELSGIASLGRNLVISARCGKDTILVELQELQVHSSVCMSGADVTALCSYGLWHVAVGMSDFTLRVLDIETGFAPAAQVQLKELIACMTPTNNHLLWFTEIGGLHLWSLQEPEKVQKVDTVGLKTAGLQALAADTRGELYAVVTAGLAASFRIELSQSKPQSPVLVLLANADSPDQYFAIQQRQDGLNFVDSAAQSVECRVGGDPSPLLFAHSGDGSALCVRMLGQGFVFKQGTAGVANVKSIPAGITGVAGDPDGGFWLTGGSGAIWYFHERTGLTKVQQIDLRMISRAQLLCGHQTLTWVGHCTEQSSAGTDNYFALALFRKKRTWRGTLKFLGKRLFAKTDGLLTAFIQDPYRNRLLFMFQGEPEAHFLRFGTAEQFVKGSEQLVPLAGIDHDIDHMRLSPDGSQLYALSKNGTLFRLDPENFQCTAVFSATEPITDMSLNYAPDGSLLLIQNKTQILSCLFQRGQYP